MRSLKLSIVMVSFAFGVLATIACAEIDNRMALAPLAASIWWWLCLLIPRSEKVAVEGQLYWLDLPSAGFLLGTAIAVFAASVADNQIHDSLTSWMLTLISANGIAWAIAILAVLKEPSPAGRRHPTPRRSLVSETPRLLLCPPHKR